MIIPPFPSEAKSNVPSEIIEGEQRYGTSVGRCQYRVAVRNRFRENGKRAAVALRNAAAILPAHHGCISLSLLIGSSTTIDSPAR
jgi:hypothetical protein